MENEYGSEAALQEQATAIVPESKGTPERQFLGITIDITFKNVYGQVKAAFNGSVEQFPTRMPEADYIEGFIKTPYGEYILAGTRWSIANNVFNQIKRHVEAKKQYGTVEAGLRPMKDKLVAAIQRYQYGTGNPNYDLSAQVRKLEDDERRLKMEIASLDEILRPYC